MAAVTAAAVIGAGATLYASDQAGKQAKKGRDAMRDANARGAAAFAGIDIPTIEEQKIILQNPELMGEYTPEQISAMKLSVDGVAEIGPQDSTVATQEDALEQISEMAEGGLTEADMAGRRQIGRDVSSSARARQKSILNEMAQRGVLGSGAELAAQLKGEQMAMSEEAAASDRLLQQNEAARRAAIAQKANVAGSMRGQESREGLEKYRAQKAIEEFNLGLRHKDTAERNRAQLLNLGARQAQEDQRVSNLNKQHMYNKALIDKRYQDELSRASGLAGQYQASGRLAMDAANAEAQRQAGIGGAIANMAGTVGSALNTPTKSVVPTAANSAVNTTQGMFNTFDPTKLA